MASFTLQLTDGTTTIDFDGTDGYSLIDSSWAPQRAQRSESDMGAVYEDVIETIPIVITGGSPSHVMERYADLSDLLDQAESWGKDDAGVDAVLFKYQPNGSSLADPLEVAIWRELGSPRMLSAPSTVNEVGYRGNVMTPVIVTFTRKGQLLGADETKAAAETTGNPVIATAATFTDTSNIPIPFDINIDFGGKGGAAGGSPEVFVLTTNAADKLYTIECETMTGGAATVVAGASAGNVHQQADSGTASMSDLSFGMNSDARLFAFYIIVKPSAAVTNWTITATLYAISSFDLTSVTSEPVVYGGSTDKKVIKLPLMATNWESARLNITAVPDAVNGETIDLDYICGIALDDSSNIFRANPSSTSFNTGGELKIEQQLLAKRTPKVYFEEAAAIVAYPAYKGSANPQASGSSISSLVFGLSAGKYVLYDGTRAQEADITFTAIRTLGYLTPQ